MDGWEPGLFFKLCFTSWLDGIREVSFLVEACVG